MIDEAVQEVLEKLWIDIVEEEKSVELKGFGEEIAELEKLQFINTSDNWVELTSEGALEGEKIVRRHRLAERLLQDVLEVGGDEVESSACKFEHIISEDVEESICTLLGHPEICPHGKSIPSGSCCEEKEETVRRIVSPLSELSKGQEGKVAYILTRNNKNLQRLMAMGVLPGMSVEVIQTYPSYVFQVGEAQIAVDTEMAEDIFVRETTSPRKQTIQK